MSKRVLAMALAILAFFMFVGSPFQQSASAILVVDDALVALVIAALAAMGIGFAFTGGYYTLYDWIAQVMVDSGADFSGLSAGVNTKGNILLNNRFVLAVSTVAMYIKTHWNLDSNGNYVITQSTYGCLDELTGNVYTPGTVTDNFNFTTGTVLYEMSKYEANGTVRVYNYRFSGTYWRVRVSYTVNGTNVSMYTELYSSADGVDYTKVGESAISTAAAGYGRSYKVMLVLIDGDIWFCMYTGTNDYGTIGQINALAKVVGVSIGNDLSIDTDVINIPTDQAIGDKGGKLTLPVPWGSTFPDAIDEIPDLAVDEELLGNTSLQLEDEGSIVDELNSDLTNAEHVSDIPGDYQSYGLPDVFPFCIPFDIYAFFECLAADPVAPSFTWRFYIPGICDEEIEIDLAAFDTAAQILRTMELLLFIVGLAFVTRDKFLRG